MVAMAPIWSSVGCGIASRVASRQRMVHWRISRTDPLVKHTCRVISPRLGSVGRSGCAGAARTAVYAVPKAKTVVEL